ncbi:hypothetical protein ACE939_05915 [Aquimarina sp. W85]|uniref:hypothetical protein n=1 Tax=Aquimarina rhodophyticola TaxID=3342246 RepID=UPI00366FEE94
MKTILNLDGVKNLSKKEQRQVFGAARSRCWQRGAQCCVSTASGDFCDAGRCNSNGYCLYY